MYEILIRLCGFGGLVLLAITAAMAWRSPFDESADDEARLKAGLSDAQSQHKNVLVIFGANWCPNCRALDNALHGRARSLVDSRFVVVKIDVGRRDKNLDVLERYGKPIKNGLPAAVVLSADDRLLYATQHGELSNAQRMSENSVYDFFSRIVAGHSQAT